MGGIKALLFRGGVTVGSFSLFHSREQIQLKSCARTIMSVDPIEITSLETEITPQINTAAKRLTEPDIQAVFRCLWSNQQPPKRLEFRIIRVPQNGLKLSPPSFEFDGESFPPTLSTWHE
jgi:hypothetical protein